MMPNRRENRGETILSKLSVAPLSQMKHNMGETIWNKFPADLFVNVARFLPFQSLLGFRSVSKHWNALPLDPHLQLLRGRSDREFKILVLSHRKYRECYLISSTGPFILMQTYGKDMFVMQPSQLRLTQIPRLQLSEEEMKFGYRRAGMVIESETGSYSIFVASLNVNKHSSYQSSNLHRYDSRKKVWCACGNIQDFWGGVVLHKGSYLLLVRPWTGSIYRNLYEIKRYDGGSGMWVTMPGMCPYLGQGDPLLFNFDGRLLFGAQSLDAFFVWENLGEDGLDWKLETEIPFSRLRAAGEQANRAEHVNFGLRDHRFELYEDSLYMRHTCGSVVDVQKCYYNVKYNLVTKQLETAFVDLCVD